MANVRILIDSTADISPAECAEKGLGFVSMNVHIAGQSYADAVDLKVERFYQLLTESSEFPKTSQPSPEQFAVHFEKAKAEGVELVCIVLSSSLSGTCQSAHIAKELVGYEKIHIVDSRSISAGIRILTEHALRMIENGATGAQVADELNELKTRIRLFAALDTLEYLAKGGRLGKAAANIGTMFHLKPVITLSSEGEVDIYDKQIGKVRAMQSVIKALSSETVDLSFPICTVYADSPANTQLLEKRMEDAGFPVAKRVQIGPAIGAHVGPGAYGAIYVVK